MEQQRRLRLGDILDDYCPRERRVTNHAIVAMIEDDVKQTRCTTCDAEHVYKGGKSPRRKKADTTKALYKEVLAGITDPESAAALASPVDADEPTPAVEPIANAVETEPEERENPVQPQFSERESMADIDDEDIQPDMPTGDEGPVHRPLIRAQLPRVEGVKVERQAPDFTIRQPNLRGGQGHFRGGDMRGRQGNGAGNGSSGSRFSRGPQQRAGGGRGGTNQGFGRGPGGGGQPRQGGGNGPRKRGR